MDNTRNKDYFEIYLERFHFAPSLVIVRSVEAKNFPFEYVKEPVLDACCGDGFFAKVIGLDKFYTVGVDMDKNAIEYAKNSGVFKEVKLEDVRSLESLPDEFFNTVIANCAFEQVDGINEALKAISAKLSNGGILIMSVPTPKVLECFPSKDTTKAQLFNERQKHINLYPKEEWKKLLDLYDFKIIKHFYLFTNDEYKKVIFFDALPEILGKYLYIVYRGLIKLMPKGILKVVFRKVLKDIYLKSTPLQDGGELMIVAQKVR